MKIKQIFKRIMNKSFQRKDKDSINKGSIQNDVDLYFI